MFRDRPVKISGTARSMTLKKLRLVCRGPSISFWMANTGSSLTKKIIANTISSAITMAITVRMTLK